MGVRHIYLLRHGSYIKRGSHGLLGPPLSALGRKQAGKAGKYFSRLPVDAIYASTLNRARETAEIVSESLEGVKIHRNRLLWEAFPTPIPGREYSAEDMAVIEDHRQRADRVFAKYFRPSRTDRLEIIAAHGNLIRYLVVRAIGAPPEHWFHLDTLCCGISAVAVLPEGEKILLSYNESGHLPPSMRSED
ncbi:MAG: histidine phosphatase family protein [Planctomycetota bacterium]